MVPDSTHRPVHKRDELASDLRDLLRFVETLHAEPFVGYDSRTALHARVERLVRDLPESATAEEFYRLAAPVVSGLEDAHSLLRPPDPADGPERRLPLSLRVVGTDLYVESVTDESLADLVGRRLLAVEGSSTSDLVDRSRALRGAENRYGTALLAAGMLERPRPLARLLDRETPPDSVTLEVAADGGARSVEVAPVDGDAREPVARLERTVPGPTGSGPRYRLYEGGDAAVFVPGNLSDYRESLEAKLTAGADADVAADLASRAYDRQVGGDRPDDLETTVAALPSMTGTLETIAEAMAAAETETLFVDLRGNSGGDSQFVFHLAYLLGGWDGVARAAEGVSVVTRRTDPYRRRYGGEGSASDGYGDYDFGGLFGSSDAGEVPPQVRQLLSRSETAAEFVEGHDDGLYAPERVVAVVSAGTMSSAFACAAQLGALGADVVGVPSGQGPVSFGEHVERPLPNTGLTVRLAGSMFRWTADPSGDVLEPDCELTPARFEAYDRAGDAGLRLAFDHAGYGGSPPTPVE